MNSNPLEFNEYLKNPGDPELKLLFEEIEDCLQQYDEISAKVKRLCQSVKDMEFSIDLELAEWKYEIYL